LPLVARARAKEREIVTIIDFIDHGHAAGRVESALECVNRIERARERTRVERANQKKDGGKKKIDQYANRHNSSPPFL
jgi:hypothetical protein